MIDLQFIRDNAALVQEKAKQKQVEVDVARLLELDGQRRSLQASLDELRQQRNELAAQFKSAKPTTEQIQQGKDLKERIAALEAELGRAEAEFQPLYESVPNMPTDDTPVGATEDDNVVTKTVGEPRQFDFTPRSDAELGAMGDFIDKERAAKIAGSRFAYLKGGLVQMQFAIIQLVMDVLTSEDTLKQIAQNAGLKISTKPFVPVLPPPMIRTDVYKATARLNGAEVTYKLEDDDLWLNGSAEHSMCAMYMDEILDEARLPIRLIGYATSFRREAGTYGKDMEGIFRMHHFDKLEMESFTTAESSYDEHLFMVAIQEYLVTQLDMPYQVMLKCTADIGNPNARGVDINTWMPSQSRYRETHSADLITDYQTRRLKTRIRRTDGSLQLAHTNDATAFALGRTLKAIMENYQQADGRIAVPKVLQPYMHGREIL